MSGQASELSTDDVRSAASSDQWRTKARHLAVKGQVGDDPLQSRILVLDLLQPTHLVRQQPAIALLPVELGRLADPGLAADLRDRRASLALLQDERLSRACVNLDAFIVLSSFPSQGRSAENSSFIRSSFRAAEHREIRAGQWA